MVFSNTALVRRYLYIRQTNQALYDYFSIFTLFYHNPFLIENCDFYIVNGKLNFIDK